MDTDTFYRVYGYNGTLAVQHRIRSRDVAVGLANELAQDAVDACGDVGQIRVDMVEKTGDDVYVECIFS
jgi:hypothetical protein